jgi:hypothetical protein
MALRNPDWGNKWLTTFGTVQHRNLTGDLREYQRSAVLIEDGFEITISANALSDVQTFETAYLAALATQITYTDFEGTVWTGYWIPDSYSVKRGRAGCNYQITVQFSGTHS